MKDEDRQELGDKLCQSDIGDTCDFCNLACPNKEEGDNEQGNQTNSS